MSSPLIQGDNPSLETIQPNLWVLLFQSVNYAKITNLYSAGTRVYLTYVKTGDAAPDGFNDIPKWMCPESWAEFGDGITLRDVYGYAVGNPAELILEA